MNITFEEQRLEILKNFNILDSDREKEYDEITSLAAKVCNTPIALIAFCDSDRQFIKSNIGFGLSEIPRDNSLCSYVIEADNKQFIISDLLKNPEFKSHPFTKPPMGVRFYAGVALISEEGYPIGTICVMDDKPRNFSSEELKELEILRNQTVRLLEIRKKNLQLQNNLSVYKQAEKIANVGSFEWDLQTNVIKWSDGWKRFNNFYQEEKTEYFDKKKEKFFNFINREYFLSKLENAKKNGTPFREEVVIESSRSEHKIIDLKVEFIKDKNTGIPKKLFGVGRDISYQRSLLNHNNSLASIIEKSLNEIYIFDSKTLQFIFLNRGALDNTGYTMEEARSLTPIDLKPDYSVSSFRNMIEPLINGKKEILVFQTTHKRKDQSLYDVEVHLQKMFYRNREVFTAIIIDITRATNDEKRLKELHEKLVKSNERLKYFAATTAHDLKEPLRMISNFSDLLRTRLEGQLNEKTSKYLYFISDAANRMQQLIYDILEYSEIEAGKLKKTIVDLKGILLNVMSDLEPSISSKKAILNLPDEYPVIRGNEILLYRVFQNLINNSLKYSKENQRPKITLSIKEDFDCFLFTIADNGIGIEEKYLNKIFDLYVRLHSKAEFQGTGLGLAIVQKIIHLHGGEIWVESIPGEGSQFYFKLPK